MSDDNTNETIKVIDSTKITISKKPSRIAKLITLDDYNKNNSFRRTNKIFVRME